MLGHQNLDPISKVKAKEALLQSDKSFSPAERKLLRKELQKERKSIERAQKYSPKRESPLINKNKVFSNLGAEGQFDLRDSLYKLQSSAKKLSANEHTLGRGAETLFK